MWPPEGENKFPKGLKIFVFGGKMELESRKDSQDVSPGKIP